MVPGDPVDAMLLLQGINHESSNYRSEYEKMYIKTGVNKPLSYISVQPHFYHPDLYKITDQTFRNQTMELLHQKRSYTDIQDFITVRDDFIKLAGRDTLYNNPQIRDKIKNLSFITDIREIKNEINALSALQKSDLSPSYSSLVASFQKMEAGKIFFFIPTYHGMALTISFING